MTSEQMGRQADGTDPAEGVARLYEEHPYPDHGVVSRVVATMLAPSVRARQRESGRRRLRALDAGCGTGEQTLGLARAFPELDVLGIDLNPASVQRAQALAAKTGIRAQFARRDLLQPLDGLAPFDLIVSVGVLHHLPAPDTALANLRAAADPHAILLGMVYGVFGRWESFQVRDALALIGDADATREQRLRYLSDLRQRPNSGLVHYLETLLRRRRFGPHIRWSEAVRRVLAGRSTTYQADAYTHAHERGYAWAEVAELVQHAGWHFRGWPQRSGMPDAPASLFRGEARRELEDKPVLAQAAVYERVLRPPTLYFLASASA